MILSISQCICDIHPNLNGCLWDKHEDIKISYKAQLGLAEEKYTHLVSTVVGLFNGKRLDIDGRFINLSDAQSFYTSFLFNRADAKIIGVALMTHNIEKLIGEPHWGQNAATPRDIPSAQMQLLGGEIIGFDIANFHSYLCNGLDKDISERYAIVTDDYGIIQNDYSQIELFTESIQGEGEPVLWLPCMLYNCGL